MLPRKTNAYAIQTKQIGVCQCLVEKGGSEDCFKIEAKSMKLGWSPEKYSILKQRF
jgi:hypothetical protein